MPEIARLPIFSDTNLISYYKLEDLLDSIGSNTLINNNSVAFNPALYNNGADFGSSNTNKILTNATDLGISGNHDISVSFWVKVTTELSGAGNSQYTFIDHASTTNPDQLFVNYIRTSNINYLQVVDLGSDSATYQISLGTSIFHHLVIVRDTTNGKLKLYVDDTLQINLSYTRSGTTPSGFSIGGSYNGGTTGNFTSAIIDDVAVFNRVLTPTEVDEIYHWTKSLTDSTSLGENFSYIRIKNLNLTEIISLIETFIYFLSRSFINSISLVENFVIGYLRFLNLVDIIVPSEWFRILLNGISVFWKKIKKIPIESQVINQ